MRTTHLLPSVKAGNFTFILPSHPSPWPVPELHHRRRRRGFPSSSSSYSSRHRRHSPGRTPIMIITTTATRTTITATTGTTTSRRSTTRTASSPVASSSPPTTSPAWSSSTAAPASGPTSPEPPSPCCRQKSPTTSTRSTPAGSWLSRCRWLFSLLRLILPNRAPVFTKNSSNLFTYAYLHLTNFSESKRRWPRFLLHLTPSTTHNFIFTQYKLFLIKRNMTLEVVVIALSLTFNPSNLFTVSSLHHKLFQIKILA